MINTHRPVLYRQYVLFSVGFICRIPKKFWKKFQENYLFLHRLYQEVRRHSFFLFCWNFGFQSGKKSTAHSYCATFCTQLLRTPRLAGSGNNGSGNGENNARLINRYARMLLGWLIKQAGMVYFWHFTFKKTKLWFPAYAMCIFGGLLINRQYVKRVCGKIVSVFDGNFLTVFCGK